MRQTKDLTQIWGVYKIYSKKRFLDSMDWRETYKMHLQNIPQGE